MDANVLSDDFDAIFHDSRLSSCSHCILIIKQPITLVIYLSVQLLLIQDNKSSEFVRVLTLSPYLCVTYCVVCYHTNVACYSIMFLIFSKQRYH